MPLSQTLPLTLGSDWQISVGSGGSASAVGASGSGSGANGFEGKPYCLKIS